jgi:hypothetical protein
MPTRGKVKMVNLRLLFFLLKSRPIHVMDISGIDAVYVVKLNKATAKSWKARHMSNMDGHRERKRIVYII